MSDVTLVFSPAMAAYDFGSWHPLKPARVLLTVELMRAYGLLDLASVHEPKPASDQQLALVHSAEYIQAVKEAGADPERFESRMGLGTADDPLFPRMHEAASLIAGGSVAGLTCVLDGRVRRAFSVAGGLHHAHRDHAAGFCIYNDPAVAIASALDVHPQLCVLYIDIDAHHGDGVQEAFYDSSRVMTISLHESGRYLFPGTGFPADIGTGAGKGFSVNVPLPPRSGDEAYMLAFDRVVRPLARAFGPDVIVGQFGCDAHRDDPLTDLGLTLPGYRRLVGEVVGLADRLCGGRLLACGGGGYSIHSVVPRAWTIVLAELLGVELDEELPAAWREHVERSFGRPPERLTADAGPVQSGEAEQTSLHEVGSTIAEVRELLFPLHGLTP